MTEIQEKSDYESGMFGPGAQVAVMIPTALGGPYDYRAVEAVGIGAGVRVPFGRRSVLGVVWGPGVSALPPAKIRAIEGLVEGVQFSPDYIKFLDWVSSYTLADPGAVLRLGAPVDWGKPLPPPSKRGKPIYGDAPDPGHRGVGLTPEQQEAAQVLVAAVAGGAYGPLLLDGVTGAGKTEVYFEAVAQALRDGKQVLILQPEIALTTAFVERFKRRFGQEPALWHSGLTPVQRQKTWHGIVNGAVRVVAGARSALMLPFPQLGLIVVDEEHESAYKQEEGVLYHARDMAVARAHHFGFPVILSSATPSLETMANVWAGRYRAVALPGRFASAQMPEVRLLDLRADPPARGTFIAPTLYQAMEKTLARGEQALLFLNRRGYAPLTLCRACGYRLTCPRCSAWMVEHRRTHGLHCHHCGHVMTLPSTCPACQEGGSFVACGPGVERIAEEVAARFPNARLRVLSSDLTDHPRELAVVLDDIAGARVDIIVGTQIIAKGHHFPLLTLVGVVDADLGLAGGDLRAGERTFQLLHQVAGRAGRAERPGVVYLQTYDPDNKVMQALAGQARDAFLTLEAAERQAASMPPYGRLVALILSGVDEKATRAVAHDLARAAPAADDFRVWGPAEAPIFRLRGKYRFRLLVQAARGHKVQKTVAEWISRVKIPAAVSLRVDVDPQSFM